jgi:hypothetical protein
MILSFWGSILLASYPQDVVNANLLSKTQDRNVRDAAAKKKDFQAALQILFPGGQPAKLAEFPQLDGIGARIGCLCLLIRMSERNEKATSFFLNTVDDWQKRRAGFRNIASCAFDLAPSMSGEVSPDLKDTADKKKKAFESAKSAASNDRTATAETKQRLETAREELQQAKQALDKAQEEFNEKTAVYKGQSADFDTAMNFCHVEQPNIPPGKVSRNR